MNLTIVLPTYNEAQNLPEMVRTLLALPLQVRAQVLVVDDNSPDGTGSVADELARQHPDAVRVLHRRHKEGLGPAYVAGFSRALADGADLILQMDCDFSHRPEDIPRMLEAAAGADAVIGSRFCRGGGVDRSWHAGRRLLSRFANGVWARAALGLPVHDATGGFRLWHRRTLVGIDPARRLTLTGYGFQVEMAYLAHRLGYRIAEVPIYFPARARGDSKMSTRIAMEAALQIPCLRWRHAGLTPRTPRAPAGDAPASAWSPMPSRRVVHLFVLLLLIGLALRLGVMHSAVLIPEEAYYWVYAQHPNMSYFDHPPMVAWVIRAGTLIFGDTEFGVRIVGSLLMCAASVLLYLYGRMWYGRRAALIAAAALIVLPAYFVTGFIATMDAPLVFFWTACLLGTSMALRNGRPIGWYLAGAAIGAAMLSKYTGVFLGLGCVLAVVGCRPYRRHLLTVHPYLAALLAVAVFSPVLVWNAANDWASFRFQFVDRFAGGGLNLADPLEFVGAQFAVATPVLVIWTLWLWALLLRSRRRLLTPRWWIAMCFGAPLLGVMAYKSLSYGVHINWTLPAYLSLMPAGAHLALVAARRARLRGARRGALRGVYWTAAVCMMINIAIAMFLLVGQPRLRVISAFGPWPELASVVEEYEDRMEAEGGHEPLIIGHGQYRLASVLAFYRTPLEEPESAAHFTTSQWLLDGRGLGFEYWTRPGDWLGKNCLIADFDENGLHDVRRRFERVEVSDDARLKSLGYRLALCYGYRGPWATASRQ